MIRVLSIVRELAMIMLKSFWLFYNGIFKIGYAGRIIDKAHMYEAANDAAVCQIYMGIVFQPIIFAAGIVKKPVPQPTSKIF